MSQLQKLEFQNKLDANDIPTGGYVRGIGISITWQDGPIGRDGEKKIQNGAFVEDVLEACLSRLKYYQGTKFNCPENVLAVSGIEEAVKWLRQRTEDREKRLVEGTHQI
ncbi:MAG TPA: hypothetical protein VK859_01650 [bacterium]|jgi:hypothetical protein|nr:hypothetical protein [bacterium]